MRRSVRIWLIASALVVAVTMGPPPGRIASARQHLAITATPPPCQPSTLSATAGWQGATGSLAGGIYLTNTGPGPCMLTGHPTVRLVDAVGHTVPVTTSRPTNGTVDGPPVKEVDLVPGSRAFVFLWWMNWCGALIKAPLTVDIQLPANGGLLSAKSAGMVRDGTVIGPRCDAPQSGSWLSVGDFEPPSNGPADSIRALYQAINRREYAFAYIYLAPLGRPDFRAYAAGYRSTAHVTLDRLAIPLYRIRQDGHTFTCVGLQITARVRGGVQTYDGWIMTASWDIVLSGSRMIAGSSLVLPDRSECAASIPPQIYVTNLNRAGQFFLIAPRQPHRQGWRVRATLGIWNPGVYPLDFPQSGCPAGNPLVLVEDRRGSILYPDVRSPLHCPHPGNPLILPANQNLERTVTVTLRGPYLQAAAIVRDDLSGGYIAARGNRLRLQLNPSQAICLAPACRLGAPGVSRRMPSGRRRGLSLAHRTR